MALKVSEKTGENEYTLTVTVDGATFEAAVNKVYLKQKNKINVPGFRKGKAPRHFIEKLYGEGVFYEDALDEVFPAAYSAALEESGVEAVSSPFDLDIVSIGKDGVELKVKVSSKPEIKLGEYKGMEVECEAAAPVTDEDVAHELSHMQEENARMIDVDGRNAENGDIATIDFVNWEVGSNFYMSLSEYDQSVPQFTATYQLPQALDENRTQELTMVQQRLESIGIDYMTPASANLGESCNAYYFVREVNGFPETYVKTYFGTQALGADGYPVMNLWTQEYVEAVVQAGKLVSLKWQNPSEIVQIDNENAKLLPWDTIEQRCKEQLDRMLTPATYSPSGEPTAIHINRIELGLTKLLMPNSESYKLIPTWSFLGYDEGFSSQATDVGAEICFVTINALDGSIVDRGNMY